MVYTFIVISFIIFFFKFTNIYVAKISSSQLFPIRSYGELLALTKIFMNQRPTVVVSRSKLTSGDFVGSIALSSLTLDRGQSHKIKRIWIVSASVGNAKLINDLLTFFNVSCIFRSARD